MFLKVWLIRHSCGQEMGFRTADQFMISINRTKLHRITAVSIPNIDCLYTGLDIT